MESKIYNFLKKCKFLEEDIMYLIRDGRKSSIHLADTRIISTYIPIKAFLDYFNSNAFIIINKGIAVNVAFISKIENSIYTMCDGAEFKGRSRTPGQHKKNTEKLLQNTTSAKSLSERIPDLFAVMDKSPIAFAVIELLFDEDGHGVDFVFRYCNDSMLLLEGRTSEEILNKSFYEVFKDSNRKWLVSYADVALNGTKKVISYYVGQTNRKILAYCYQPFEGFCACSLIEVDSIIKENEIL